MNDNMNIEQLFNQAARSKFGFLLIPLIGIGFIGILFLIIKTVLLLNAGIK
jgi:hypothetical protein